ncbi:MAG: LOG family protein [Thauera phenolivorans]|uniref:AMP nucleosidase n=1 Tax=Thauera phenolivorans TaxID=1792543 RepID=A0A7X7LU79_9RHOO|nr:LOG family protein [Thauera phenolivorans]NLF53509.1 LOG family protein [Thauera phenolivorans]
MNDPRRLRARNFPSAQDEVEAAQPHSPYDRPGSSFRMAFADSDFLLRDELRPVRLQLELLKAELVQQEQGVDSTVVVFGSARFKSPEVAAAMLEDAVAGGDETAIRRAQQMVKNARWYEEARRFGELVTQEQDALGEPVIVATGGGPGIMEAGNRGAHEAGGRSMGMSIFLPFEEAPNPYITPELCFQFHYFAIRKMHFLMRAVALVSFPGGLGTLDELFEVLTLTQTGKIRRRPIILIGRDFWQRLIDFEVLVEHGVISPADVNLFHYAETAEEAWDAIKAAYSGDNPSLTARQLRGN